MRRVVGTFLLGIGTLLKTVFTIIVVAAVAVGIWIPIGKAIAADPASAKWLLIPFGILTMGLTWWIVGLAYNVVIAFPLALITAWLLGEKVARPRKQPTAEELYYEVWRLGAERAQRAIIGHYASPAGIAEDDNPSLQIIVKAAVKTHTDVRWILERRARLAGVFEPGQFDLLTVRHLAEALALDPDDAIETATRRFVNPGVLLREYD